MGERRCWCGATDLTAFSPDYRICRDCHTLVATALPEAEIGRVDDDERDFYGRRYWFEYQERELGTPDITIRARQDLPQRCVHWLRTVLRYRLPPGRALDVGCAHGGFVMLLARAGYDATGLELSPWVVDFARKTFDVPMLQGPIETQSFAPGSFHVITMMDVVEHLADPVATLDAATAALRDDGLLLIQTPAVPPDLSFDDMVAANHPFLPLMRERGHLFLFNRASLQSLLERAGLAHVRFEPAFFPAYDMFAAASRRPLAVACADAVDRALGASADGRLVQALLDLDDSWHELQIQYEHVERDRAARLAALHEHGARLVGAEGERNALLREMENFKDLGKRLMAAEVDRAARLAVIQDLGRQLAASETDRAARLRVIEELAERLAAAEADRAARLTVIEQLSERLAAAEADRDARLAVIDQLTEQLAVAEADRAARFAVIQEQGDRLAAAETDRAARLAAIQELTDRVDAARAAAAARETAVQDLSARADAARADAARHAAQAESLRGELAALRFVRARRLVHRMLGSLRAVLGR
jgi:SAM-dependent methyltransferase